MAASTRGRQARHTIQVPETVASLLRDGKPHALTWGGYLASLMDVKDRDEAWMRHRILRLEEQHEELLALLRKEKHARARAEARYAMASTERDFIQKEYAVVKRRLDGPHDAALEAQRHYEAVKAAVREQVGAHIPDKVLKEPGRCGVCNHALSSEDKVFRHTLCLPCRRVAVERLTGPDGAGEPVTVPITEG